MKLTIVYDNETRRPDLTADWGFACVIQTPHNPTILFDTGAKEDILLNNMSALNISPQDIDIVVVSHDHWDHNGGFKHIAEINKQARIYLPPSFKDKTPPHRTTIAEKPMEICSGVFTTGELGGIEQSLAVATARGLIVVVGCSHPGVGLILDSAAAAGRVYGIVGGFHGFDDFPRLKGLTLIAACHCTRHIEDIARLYPHAFMPCGVGTVLEIEPTEGQLK